MLDLSSLRPQAASRPLGRSVGRSGHSNAIHALTLVAAARRHSRSSSPVGRSWSPAARATRPRARRGCARNKRRRRARNTAADWRRRDKNAHTKTLGDKQANIVAAAASERAASQPMGGRPAARRARAENIRRVSGADNVKRPKIATPHDRAKRDESDGAGRRRCRRQRRRRWRPTARRRQRPRARPSPSSSSS